MASDSRDILVQNLVFIRFHKTLHFGFKYDKNFSQYYRMVKMSKYSDYSLKITLETYFLQLKVSLKINFFDIYLI